MLVHCQIVRNNVKMFAGVLPIDALQESKVFLMSNLLGASALYTALMDGKRCQQARCAMSRVGCGVSLRFT